MSVPASRWSSSPSEPAGPAVQRLLDANANRAREALRVMEDAARFLLDDATLSERAKQLRHDFAAAVRRLPDLPLARDTPGDVGTGLTSEGERDRADAAAVAVAAGKRLSESLRCCEEYGKLVDGRFAAAVKQLRYRGYELERVLNERMTRRHAPQWQVCVLVTERLCGGHDWLDVARAAVEGGADCLQLREKSLEAGELLDRATRLVEAVEGAGVDVIINDRPDVAVMSGAAGVHLGEDDLPVTRVRTAFGRSGGAAGGGAGRRLLIGASTHDVDEAGRAIEAGADYCGVGAMYPTATKARQTSGLAYLREFVQRWPNVPHLAIGGIDGGNVDAVVETGAKGVAVSGAVCGAADPRRAVLRLVEAVRRGRAE